jgi:hypothetical protein
MIFCAAQVQGKKSGNTKENKVAPSAKRNIEQRKKLC